MILGIDPAFRNTGLCLLGQAEPKFSTIRTPTSQDMVTASRHITDELNRILPKLKGHVKTVSIERQLSVGPSLHPCSLRRSAW